MMKYKFCESIPLQVKNVKHEFVKKRNSVDRKIFMKKMDINQKGTRS